MASNENPIKRVRVGSFEAPIPNKPLIANVPIHTSDGRVIDSSPLRVERRVEIHEDRNGNLGITNPDPVLEGLQAPLANLDEYDRAMEQLEPEGDQKGVLDSLKETVVELKDKITGNTPAKKAYHKEVKYAKKELKELIKENKYLEEAEEYAEKGAKKAEKYAKKAEKCLEKERKAAEKAAIYHEKAHDSEIKLQECREAHILKAAETLHDAEIRLQEAH